MFVFFQFSFLDNNGFLSMIGDNGELRSDLSLPDDYELATDIQTRARSDDEFLVKYCSILISWVLIVTLKWLLYIHVLQFPHRKYHCLKKINFQLYLPPLRNYKYDFYLMYNSLKFNYVNWIIMSIEFKWLYIHCFLLVDMSNKYYFTWNIIKEISIHFR